MVGLSAASGCRRCVPDCRPHPPSLAARRGENVIGPPAIVCDMEYLIAWLPGPIELVVIWVLLVTTVAITAAKVLNRKK